MALKQGKLTETIIKVGADKKPELASFNFTDQVKWDWSDTIYHIPVKKMPEMNEKQKAFYLSLQHKINNLILDNADEAYYFIECIPRFYPRKKN